MSSMMPVRRGFTTLSTLLLIVSTMVRAEEENLHLPQPMFPQVTDAWRSGRVAKAIVILDRQFPPIESAVPMHDAQPVEALILRATLYREAGRHQEAEATWRAVFAREVWMRTFARRAIIESLVDRGTAAEAAPVLEELNRPKETRHLDLTLRVAEAHRNAGETQEARRLYREMLGRQPRSLLADSARLGIAAMAEEDGDVATALAQLREAKLQHWGADAFEVAAQTERRLLAVHGGSLAPIDEAQYRTLVRRLRNASRFESALALINEWRTAHAQETGVADIEAEWITTLYMQRANEEAVTASLNFYEHFPDSPLVPSIRLADFRLAVRMVDTDRARRTGLDLWEGRVPGATSSQRRDAATLLAAYLVAVGNVSEGLDLYRQLFQSSQSPDVQRTLLWRAGVAALRDGQLERALANLKGLARRGASGDLAPAGLYWLGVAESQTDTAAAIRTLENVAKQYPYHYYGMRARTRLKLLTTEPDMVQAEAVLTFPKLTIGQATTEQAEYRAAMVLARAGLVKDAALYLGRLVRRLRNDRGLALMTARASAAAGDYASVSRLLVNHFGTFLQRPAEGLPDDFWQLVYPRPFWDDVSRSGLAHGVDPLLLVSLMRQESRFDPDARSPVGAIGLFQIMTYTAEALAHRAGVGEVVDGEKVDQAALAQPSVNSAIAARLTGDLLEMFNGSIAPVIASYNAGEERVAVWWATSRELSEDFFVDTIPYSETRRFVREVIGNRAAYERIYGNQ